MDRRSWLWRRKSSEKSPGETESSGGSMSSHSERFSDDQLYSNQSFQSPEVTSKAELQPEELEGSVKTLSRKLSEALLNISIKEDLVKQHSKVAEEAVEGWEKAESEVLALRQQVEVLTLRNSTLEDRVSHLDGALKECLRQLRQTREEYDEKMNEAIEKKNSEWQMTKAELENQLSDLRLQLQSAKKTEPSLTSIEKSEKEISALKLELASMAEELELRYIERELSNQAAEQASKLHLESAKKATKFEAECRRLNAALRKALATNGQKSIVESDDPKETNEFESNRTKPAKGINLMDDFLEMERLVALPKSDPSDSLQSLQNRLSEVEEALKRVEMDKQNVEISLSERENELKTSRNELKVAKSKLVKLEALLINANDARETTEKELVSVNGIVNVLQERVKRSDLEVAELKRQLDIKRREAESRLEDAYTKKMEAESRVATLEAELESLTPKADSLETEVGKERDRCRELEGELESLNTKVDALETEVGKERALSGKMGDRCRELEGELESLNLKVDSLETETKKERTVSGKMGDRCRELERELESLVSKVDSLETDVEKERALSKKMGVKCRELEGEISRLQRENQYPKPAIRNPEFTIKQDTELALAGSKYADCQKTIASLSRQLKTLATLEDFLIDTNEFSRRI
ncbi:putative filament-like plant protein [Helianthus anomalus]